jgi:hypothetical protein
MNLFPYYIIVRFKPDDINLSEIIMKNIVDIFYDLFKYNNAT